MDIIKQTWSFFLPLNKPESNKTVDTTRKYPININRQISILALPSAKNNENPT